MPSLSNPKFSRARRAASALRLAALLASSSFGAGCSSSFPVPSSADAARGRSRYPDVTLPELEQGRERYLARCGNCHALIAPSSVHADKWPGEVERMRTKHKVKLTDAEAQAIVRYLVVTGED